MDDNSIDISSAASSAITIKLTAEEIHTINSILRTFLTGEDGAVEFSDAERAVGIIEKLKKLEETWRDRA